jgi:truncated hemoglobin YjbI
MRHLPFSIGPKEAEEWMRCMRGAFADIGVLDPLLGYLDRQLERTALHVLNTDTAGSDRSEP